MAGRPRLAMTGAGQLTADQIRVYLRELESDGKTKPVPDRMNAVGQVEIESPQLLARTRELVATFRNEPESPTAAVAPSAGGAPPPPSPTRFSSSKPPNPPAHPAKPINSSPISSSSKSPCAASSRCPPAWRATATSPSAKCRKTTTGEQPFEVRGGQLTADQLDGQSTAHITVRGAAPDQSPDPQLAQIQARGMTIHCRRRRNGRKAKPRCGATDPAPPPCCCRAIFPASRPLRRHPLDIRWEGGLNFDGRYVHGPPKRARRRCRRPPPLRRARRQAFRRRQFRPASRPQRYRRRRSRMPRQCRHGPPHARRHRPHFDESHAARPAEHQSEDRRDQRRRPRHHPLHPFRRSGEFTDRVAGPADPKAAAPVTSSCTSCASISRVASPAIRSLARSSSAGRVAHRLRPGRFLGAGARPHRPETIVPGTLTLTSDNLRVNEDPIAATHNAVARRRNLAGRSMGPVQMHAEGNVRIDGESPQHGLFAATAERASYEQKQRAVHPRRSAAVPGHYSISAASWRPLFRSGCREDPIQSPDQRGEGRPFQDG